MALPSRLAMVLSASIAAVGCSGGAGPAPSSDAAPAKFDLGSTGRPRADDVGMDTTAREDTPVRDVGGLDAALDRHPDVGLPDEPVDTTPATDASDIAAVVDATGALDSADDPTFVDILDDTGAIDAAEVGDASHAPDALDVADASSDGEAHDAGQVADTADAVADAGVDRPHVDRGPPECTPEASRACYGGPPNTAGFGRCRAGAQRCDGLWGPCEGEVRPRVEVCNSLDDDCDQTTDEDFLTPPGATMQLPVGICQTLWSGARSGTHHLTPRAGPDQRSYEVDCDNETAGGGWAVVFRAGGENLDSTLLDWTLNRPSTVDNATEVLMAWRDGVAVVGDWAVFPMPAEWRAQAPLGHAAAEVTTRVSINDAAPVERTLRFGRDGGGSRCDGPWAAGATSGRVCIVGTTAPFFAGFASPLPDSCGHSGQAYGEVPCSPRRVFTLAVRAHPMPLNTTCVAGRGACLSSGFVVCRPDGRSTSCGATQGSPTPEICNGRDDDCDGVVDDAPGCNDP